MRPSTRPVHVLSSLAASLGFVAVLAGCGGGSGASATDAAPSGARGPAADVKEVTATASSSDPAAASAQTDPGQAGDASAATGEKVNVDTQALATCRVPAPPRDSAESPAAFGTFNRPFAANSPWNSRPVNAVLGNSVVPTSWYYPSIASGEYGTAAFKATAADGPVTINGLDSRGVWDPDSESYKPSLTLPRWPANVTPATGGDGHAEVVDTVTGIVHSFWQLRKVGNGWQAAQYAWSKLDGRGMGDPAHYWQGARSAGVSTIGGLMRIHEIKDGDTMYRHALAMSMTFNGLAGGSTTYKFPVTGADWDAATANNGEFPIGSLMMLPPNFDVQSLATPELRKVAETLKVYGAYVVDRNWGTPFVIYVENGADFQLHPNGWNGGAANDLERLRSAMRPLASAAKWVDGNGKAYTPTTSMNLLSMRGGWWVTRGSQPGVFDTWRQAVVFPATATPIEQVNASGRAYAGVTWAAPQVGSNYRLTAFATGGASFRMTVTDNTNGAVVYDSGSMANNQSTVLKWPAANFKVTTYVKSGVGSTESVVRAELVAGTNTVATSACLN